MKREMNELYQRLDDLEKSTVDKVTAERLALEASNAKIELEMSARIIQRLQDKRMLCASAVSVLCVCAFSMLAGFRSAAFCSQAHVVCVFSLCAGCLFSLLHSFRSPCCLSKHIHAPFQTHIVGMQTPTYYRRGQPGAQLGGAPAGL